MCVCRYSESTATRRSQRSSAGSTLERDRWEV